MLWSTRCGRSCFHVSSGLLILMVPMLVEVNHTAPTTRHIWKPDFRMLGTQSSSSPPSFPMIRSSWIILRLFWGS